MASTGELWQVVGGAERGGIIVRKDCQLGSAIADGRLSHGAVIKEVEWKDGRLNYELVSGDGPTQGWVSSILRGEKLLVKAELQQVSVALEKSPQSEGSTSEDEANDNSVQGTTSGSDSEAEIKCKDSWEPTEEEKEALRQYEEKFGQNRDGSAGQGYNRKAFPWFTPSGPKGEMPADDILQSALAAKDKKKDQKPRNAEFDSAGEELMLCAHCQLPLGEQAYQGKEKGCHVHAECMAQLMVQEIQVQDERINDEQRKKKLESRREHEIGWRMDSVPKNATVAERLGVSPAPQGLCSLVLDEVSKSVRIAATHEPAAAVNLEYLLLALKVRRHACREPLFSLDPVDPNDLEKTPQKKRYEPEWLAGTSVGDVMFQADYFLKELALGEYTMPVVGMMSVFDLSEMIDSQRTWAGREWFVVRKAEVRMAEDKTLVPHIKMGVEAREQVVTKDGLQDAPITGANHPLKRFAENFTRNFDLIAERKSVIFHLRELAKASVMAKFLVDSKMNIDPRWYEVADEMVASTPAEAHPQIPQLWNMRGNSRIQLKDGKLVDSETGMYSSLQALYGGVEFGLDRFELAQRSTLPGMMLSQQQASGLQLGPSSMALGPSGYSFGSPLGPAGVGRPMFMPQRFQLTTRGEMPQGVDLNLDKFSLSAPERFAGSLPACSADLDSIEARVTLGKAFLKSFEEQSHAALEDEDKQLLKGVFNRALADRMQEDSAFTPPDPNLAYVAKLRSLVNEEQSLRERRIASFSDKRFEVGNAGSEFPRSWTSRFQIQQEGRLQRSLPGSKNSLVTLQVDATFEKALLKDILPTAAPEFNKVTEDGMVFRIYRIGSLEVRTTQEASSIEKVRAVFSLRPVVWKPIAGNGVREALDDEKILKAKLFVENACADDKRADLYHYYVVLETERSNVIVTERLADGTTTWTVNPDNVEDRNSLAKLLVTMEVKPEDATVVRKLKFSQAGNNRPSEEGTSSSQRRRYAKAIMALVCDKMVQATSGRGRAYPYPSRSKRSGEFVTRWGARLPNPKAAVNEANASA
eukprot:TRINITY_DN16083_c0_g1_i1.p1 TRINITY_DN16083_c0_g1~~TRINITY_DN16083_c0_g1_i1.p1  ORF type:complete len:1036 (-),score=244.94 TRINITY_DN16083_c0_g1_i1:61-3168(-)